MKDGCNLQPFPCIAKRKGICPACTCVHCRGVRYIVTHGFGVGMFQVMIVLITSQPAHFIVLALDLVKKLLVVDPSKRLTTEEALEHPWLQVGIGF